MRPLKKQTKTARSGSPRSVKKTGARATSRSQISESSGEDAFSAPEETITVEEILSNVRPTPMIQNNLDDEQKMTLIADKFGEIMEILGLDLNDDSLRETPRRVAKMYVKEIFSGLNPQFFPKITVIENKMHYDQMILIRSIECLSFCEHHFLTIDGRATVAYIPNKKVIGLSKINRIVQYFSRRPQVQERLTKQIADCLQFILGTEHVAVHINAKHYCLISRGIEDSHSSTVTTDLRGHFKSKPETRQEFLLHCKEN
jgi:GTP cyclohydrolase IA